MRLFDIMAYKPHIFCFFKNLASANNSVGKKPTFVIFIAPISISLKAL